MLIRRCEEGGRATAVSSVPSSSISASATKHNLMASMKARLSLPICVIFILTIASMNGMHCSASQSPDGDASGAGLAAMASRITEFIQNSVRENGTTSTCPRCVDHGKMRESRITEIKAEILAKLGLREAPSVNQSTLPLIPPLHHLLDQYGVMGDDPELATTVRREDEYDDSLQPLDSSASAAAAAEESLEDFYLTPERAISIGEQPPASWNCGADIRCQYFKFSANVMSSHVSRGHLWVHVRNQLADSQQTPLSTSVSGSEENRADGSSSNSDSRFAWVVVYEMKKPNRNESPILTHVRSKKVTLRSGEGQWETIDIRRLVTEWFRGHSTDYGLVVNAYDEAGRALVVSDHTNDPTTKSFIELHTRARSLSRKRRTLYLNCDANSVERNCCRYPLTIDFEAFGWDWIIAPKRYEAHYCSGECPSFFLQQFPHTHIVQQSAPAGASGPCCGPRKMSSISMLYYDDNNNIIHGVLPAMVVDRCGCN